jgi:capsular exopolysaccharide synthesis family protein
LSELEPTPDDRSGATRYLQALRQHWLLITSLVVVCVVAAAAYSKTATKRYEAEADVLVSPISGNDTTFLGFSILRETSDTSRAVITAARLVKTPRIAEAVAENVGLPGRNTALSKVTVTPLSQSNIISIVAKDSDPTRAAAIANGFADQLILQQKTVFQRELKGTMRRLRIAIRAIPKTERTSPEAYALQSRLGALAGLVGTPDPTLKILASAVTPTAPVWPRPVLSVAVALVASLLFGAGAAIALELVSPKMNQEEELVLTQRLPILARVPKAPRRVIQRYLSGLEPLPGELREAYRTLRASLTSSGIGREDRFPQIVLITSASEGEGKTMTSVNLATTLAHGGMRVMLVDGDLRRPMIATVFGVASGSGFADLLAGRAAPEDVLVRAPGHGDQLRLLLASPEHGALIDLLEPSRVERVLSELRLYADVVVIDSPPLSEVADALALADESDAVVVAVRLGATRRDRLNDLRRMLARRGVTPAGFVVTQRGRLRRTGYYYGSGEHNPLSRLRGPEPVEESGESGENGEDAAATGGRRRPRTGAAP